MCVTIYVTHDFLFAVNQILSVCIVIMICKEYFKVLKLQM